MKELTTNEWHDWRKKGITGSEAPVIMDTSPWQTRLDLFKRRMDLMPPIEINYPMRRGLKLEPEARTKYETAYGIEVPARCLTSEKWEPARASFDGLNEEAAHAIEIKCPGKEDHILALMGGIPDHYLFQLVHQMYVADLASIDYVSYNPDSFEKHHELARVVMKRDFKLENALLAREREFWGYIQKRSFPGFTMPQGKPPSQKRKNPLAGDAVFKVRKSRALIPPRQNRNDLPSNVRPFKPAVQPEVDDYQPEDQNDE